MLKLSHYDRDIVKIIFSSSYAAQNIHNKEAAPSIGQILAELARGFHSMQQSTELAVGLVKLSCV